MDRFFGFGGSSHQTNSTTDSSNNHPPSHSHPIADAIASSVRDALASVWLDDHNNNNNNNNNNHSDNNSQFAHDMRTAMHASMQPPPTHSRTTKPVITASPAAIRTLPEITVTPADLLDPCNRTCAICLEAIHLKHRVLRLPCAHLFHPTCIQPWLSQHSHSCPVCRYELETSNGGEAYERERRQRMAHRRPRFAAHELERLSIKQLKQLLLQRRHNNSNRMTNNTTRRQSRFVDKQDLIEYLVASEAIELVAAPPPVSQYKLSTLQSMSIKQLKYTMNEEAGVFFNPTDVVEKTDLVRLFIHSGRLAVLPEEDDNDDNENEHTNEPANNDEENFLVVDAPDDYDDDDDTNDDTNDDDLDRKPAAVPTAPVMVAVETVLEEEEEDDHKQWPDRASTANRIHTHLVMEEDTDYNTRSVNNTRNAATATTASPSVAAAAAAVPLPLSPDSRVSSSSSSLGAATSTTSMEDDNNNNNEHGRTKRRRATINNNNNNLPSSTSTPSTPAAAVEEATTRPCSISSSTATPYSANNSHSTNNHSYYANHSIAQLRSLARQHEIDLTGCLERSEIVQRIESALPATLSTASVAHPHDHENNNNNNSTTTGETTNYTTPLLAGTTLPSPPPLEDPLQDWGVSELYALAKLAHVDVSKCRSRTDITNALKAAAVVQPAVAHYFAALAPYVRRTVSQLRDMAGEQQINVSDCETKGDFIQRLVMQETTTTTHSAAAGNNSHSTASAGSAASPMDTS